MSIDNVESPLIMVFYDEERNRRLFEAMLATLGYAVVTACNGNKALLEIAAHSPDLIMMDIMMTGMDGLEVTRRLKANDETKLIPVIIVTSRNSLQGRVKALESGVDDFFSAIDGILSIKEKREDTGSSKLLMAQH